MPALQLVDSCYAWFMAVMCSWVQVWAAIIFRSSGILLVGLVSSFRISREEASWPFEICTTINCMQGFLVGVLVRYWDTRALNIGATLVASVSAIACFIANTPTAYVVFIGVGFGAGTGLMVPTNVVVLHRYFDKYRTSASGLSFAGAALSSMLLPPLIGKLLNVYGLQGTMLIIGALVLNTMAGSITLRSSPSFPRPPCHTVFSTTATTTRRSSTSSTSSGEGAENKNIITELFTSDIPLWESGIIVSALSPRSHQPRRRRHGMFSFIRNPMFVPLMATGAVYGYVFSTYLITIVDHAAGAANASHEEGAILVSTMAMGDFFSRIGTGYITDRHYITREGMLIINFALQGVCFLLLANLATVANMLVVAVLFGLNNGGTIASFPVLLADHLGDEHLPLTFGLHRFTMGVTTLTRPMLIGYFKDKHGSYNGLYYLVSAACFFVSILWCLIGAADLIKAFVLGRPMHQNAVVIPA
ncbi:monocarboxylate transporter 12-like [Dermacentor variabilis]|uniref:monocarboxylate transporter 12-like n=1 Tax=Dermacentor variabilis TaxID=34621 RepID=UPI003F5B8D8D